MEGALRGDDHGWTIRPEHAGGSGNGIVRLGRERNVRGKRQDPCSGANDRRPIAATMPTSEKSWKEDTVLSGVFRPKSGRRSVGRRAAAGPRSLTRHADGGNTVGRLRRGAGKAGERPRIADAASGNWQPMTLDGWNRAPNVSRPGKENVASSHSPPFQGESRKGEAER